MKKIIYVFFLTYIALCAGEINVAVAANASYVMEPLKEAFHLIHPETKVNVILGSSGKLTAQIKAGAPYQLFLSADMSYPQKLYEENLTIEAPKMYAQGTLAFLSRTERDFNLSMAVLEAEDIQKIAIANPKTAPYGFAAVEALKNAKLFEKLKEKLVYGESASQTVIYAMSAAEIGIVAKSSLFASSMAKYSEGKHWKMLDLNLYTPIAQGIVILKMQNENTEAQAFYDFILSREAKEIFKAYGYGI